MGATPTVCANRAKRKPFSYSYFTSQGLFGMSRLPPIVADSKVWQCLSQAIRDASWLSLLNPGAVTSNCAQSMRKQSKSFAVTCRPGE
jgi:hypothetical protein